MLLSPATVGPARAFGPTPIFGFATLDGFALLSFQGLFAPTAVAPGDLVFGDLLYIQFLDIGPNRTVDLHVIQNGSGERLYQNATFSVASKSITEFDLTLAPSTVERSVVLCVDGGCEEFNHQTPVTLLPSGVLNIGGLDLLIFATSLEFFALAIPLTAAAAAIQRRAFWAPSGTLPIALGVPHVIFGLVALALIDYPLFDQTFGGAEFIIFPALFAFFFFVWVIHKFNTAKAALVLRPDPQAGHTLRFNAWAIWVAEKTDGAKVLCGTRWRDWWARAFGHYTELVPANVEGKTGVAVAEQAVEYYRSETVGERRARFRVRPGLKNPLDQFRVAGEVDRGAALKGHRRPELLYWVDSSAWLDDSQPRLSFHREVRVPPKLDRDGNVVEPATTKSKLSWPHYVDPPSGMRLAGIHYNDAPVAALNWLKAENWSKRIENLRRRVNVNGTAPYVLADEMTEEQLAEVYRMLDRQRRPLNDLEAEEETRSSGKRSDRDKGPSSDEADRADRPGPRSMGGRPSGGK